MKADTWICFLWETLFVYHKTIIVLVVLENVYKVDSYPPQSSMNKLI